MHMADYLISPQVGGVMLAASAGLIAYCSKKVKDELDDRKIPLMGVLAAFIFAAQMINFSIPGTGSSGHLGGGLILAILLGRHAGFLAIASILIIQALFFSDGGLLALGCNIFNLGFFPCFIAYPFIYNMITKNQFTRNRIMIGSIVAVVIGLQLGAFGVVLQTVFSGISKLPFTAFTLSMQSIHLAIGLVEGLVTAAVVIFVWKARPEILESAYNSKPIGAIPVRNVVIAFFAAALITGGVLSWFASSNPDGLESAIHKISGVEELETPKKEIYSSLSKIQKKTAILPDYDYKPASAAMETKKNNQSESLMAVSSGTTISGIIGSILSLIMIGAIGFIIKRRK